ncbi:MAG: hypothetical protein J3R72DRAFT_426045 [Linnemannia gamsii]|nr:MAG: hypothetical protein J3R72DRAFT_426045 [Linnemannia gamsii]
MLLDICTFFIILQTIACSNTIIRLSKDNKHTYRNSKISAPEDTHNKRPQASPLSFPDQKLQATRTNINANPHVSSDPCRPLTSFVVRRARVLLTPFKTPTSVIAQTMSKESHTPTPPTSVPQHKENDDNDKPVSSQHIRKRDKFKSFFRSSSPEPKAKVKPQSSSPKVVANHLSTTSANASLHRLSTHCRSEPCSEPY